MDVVLEDAAHGGDAVSVRRAQAGPLGALVDGLEHAPFRCVERVEGTLRDDAANVVLVGGRHMCFVMRWAAVRHAVEVLSVDVLSTKLLVETLSTKTSVEMFSTKRSVEMFSTKLPVEMFSTK